MRECPACGASNEATDDFCGNCGSYLGWSDETSDRASRFGRPFPDVPTAAPEPTAPGTGAASGGPGAPTSPSASVPDSGAPVTAPAPAAPDPAEDGGPDAPVPDPGDPALRTTVQGAHTAPGTGVGTAAGDPVPARPPWRHRVRRPATGPATADSGAGPAVPSAPADQSGPSVPDPGDPAHRTTVQGAHTAPGTGVGTAAGDPAPARPPWRHRIRRPATGPAATDTGAGPAVPSTPADHSGHSSPSVADAPSGTGAAASQDAPAADPPPPTHPSPVAPPTAPLPVKPAKAVAARPVVRPVAADEDTAGVPCPVCRTLNPPHRRFCRRCAAPLAVVAAPAPLPWWRTVWPFRRRRTRSNSGRLARLLVVLAVLLALCAAGFLLLPAGRALIEDTRDKLGKATAVTPARVTATAQLPGHAADRTTDGLANRYWAVPGSGASVTYTFGKPFRLVDLILTNGASKSAEEYFRQGRALKVEMAAVADDGQVTRRELDLSDKPGSQTFPLGISHVTSVRLTLGAPVGVSGGRHIALAEVEFFQRA
ncbi:zinc ribbon domain-containing protein [Streptomyces sp. LP11]|uniref:Zinc ribbon domain-containing protein n=1 Tax=Streptomyces pyxinicus TaxID=2970331 RepID=A0ABT2BAW8_9ACTN|nr:zinc ribbon domain-containing protein [Streptomyces sp. LP11]MCS0605667.1 zinc ribbon domain-containing protein [Streptomyces sp. LP11]